MANVVLHDREISRIFFNKIHWKNKNKMYWSNTLMYYRIIIKYWVIIVKKKKLKLKCTHYFENCFIVIGFNYYFFEYWSHCAFRILFYFFFNNSAYNFYQIKVMILIDHKQGIIVSFIVQCSMSSTTHSIFISSIGSSLRRRGTPLRSCLLGPR